MCAAPADRGDEADSAGKQGQTLIIPVVAAAVPEINMCSHCHVDADGEVHIGVLFSRRAFSALPQAPARDPATRLAQASTRRAATMVLP
ncbi:hypothetical protein OEZ86_001470 [Tetradesmus obliquus]|nr:hypothetical protein OEZ86_001470 [Tetradesmus obliquus]